MDSGNDSQRLESETRKWIGKLEPLAGRIEGDRDFVSNIKAYLSDSKHFLEKGDRVRAFEAVVWAWAWYEIGIDKGFIKHLSNEGE